MCRLPYSTRLKPRWSRLIRIQNCWRSNSMTDDKIPDNLDSVYPIGEKQPDRVRTRNGHTLAHLTLDNLQAGRVNSSDFRITADGLRLQAEIAERAGRPNLAQNL